MTAPDGWETKAAAFRARRDAEERVAKTRVKVRGDGGQFMWTVHFKAQEWLGGRDSWETEAVTADDAVNNVRWRLFGKTPAAALPHMEAVVQTRELNALEKMRLLDKLMEGERWWTNRKTDSAALLGSRVRRAR